MRRVGYTLHLAALFFFGWWLSESLKTGSPVAALIAGLWLLAAIVTAGEYWKRRE